MTEIIAIMGIALLAETAYLVKIQKEYKEAAVAFLDVVKRLRTLAKKYHIKDRRLLTVNVPSFLEKRVNFVEATAPDDFDDDEYDPDECDSDEYDPDDEDDDFDDEDDDFDDEDNDFDDEDDDFDDDEYDPDECDSDDDSDDKDSKPTDLSSAVEESSSFGQMVLGCIRKTIREN